MSFKNQLKRSFEGGVSKASGFFDREHWNEDRGTFSRPQKNLFPENYLAIGLAITIVFGLVVGSFYYWNKSESELSEVVQIKKINTQNPWYAVKLIDGEVIYGKIIDINTDPLVVESVYYNYDQKKSENDKTPKRTINETGDLRLVKRGNETHGPDGKLQIFRAQVVFMENLRADSKVLRVIEENEK